MLNKKPPYAFKDESLLDHRSFIGGEWVAAASGAKFLLYNPEDNTTICEIADLGRADAARALEAAQKAFTQYKTWSHRERRWLIRRWADLIKANKEDLAAICTLELGKPYTESLVTVKYGTDFLDWFETAIERQYGDTIPAAKGENRIFTIRQPQGVVAAITPWNSPIAILRANSKGAKVVTRKVGAAIAAGNTVVCKPAPETPLCAIAVAKLFERAGGPPGVFNIITSGPSNAQEIGAEFTQSKIVKHLSFTGSTAVGRYLHAECAKTFKKTSMELGGNAPFIVFEDAELDKAAEASKFRSSGQTCVCANRIFVHSSVLDEFAKILAQKVKATFRYGSVWDAKVNFGPLYSPKALEKIEAQKEDAIAQGGEIHVAVADDVDTGALGPNFHPPTIVTKAKTTMRFMKEETFGPLAFLVPFDTDEEVIQMANDVDAGLAAYFYTRDITRLWKVSEALETGMVGVRVGLISACEQPFGGIKTSGVGREGGKEALDEYTEIKSITVGI
ncbi:putative succinate-semialdehyde dehydrogenase [Cladophialophora carrionii]|uniref:Succinate-semialdehyde dehydrogenase, mitochondrial n=1 Tax=Cladophialophora carrionii TaxID=86049 RepID=A0A1C1CTD1_9EURO|nr:putative succinate-semialdehyde dehydrogenase [Cladophialophora carrionii]